MKMFAVAVWQAVLEGWRCQLIAEYNEGRQQDCVLRIAVVEYFLCG
jgi:hypothetical protein